MTRRGDGGLDGAPAVAVHVVAVGEDEVARELQLVADLLGHLQHGGVAPLAGDQVDDAGVVAERVGGRVGRARPGVGRGDDVAGADLDGGRRAEEGGQVGAAAGKAGAAMKAVEVAYKTSPITVGVANNLGKIGDFIEGLMPGPPPMTKAGVLGGAVSAAGDEVGDGQ